MKLNKFISKYQTSSKKKAEKYISQGKVKVNKSIVTDIFFEVDKGDKVLLNNKWVKERWVTNPDGLNGEWLVQTKINNKNVWVSPMVILNLENGKHIGILLEIENNKIKNENPIPTHYFINNEFIEKSFNIRQCYHPNEILANLIAQNNTLTLLDKIL